MNNLVYGIESIIYGTNENHKLLINDGIGQNGENLTILKAQISGLKLVIITVGTILLKEIIFIIFLIKLLKKVELKSMFLLIH